MPTDTSIKQPEFQYEYPLGLDLRPGYETHNVIVSRLLGDAMMSANDHKTRIEKFKEMDDNLKLYTPLSEVEKLRKAKKPSEPVSIVYPYSVAILETTVSYLMNALLHDPIFMYDWVDPNSMIGSILMEKVVQQQAIDKGMMLKMYTLFRDNLAYGFGLISPQWVTEIGAKMVQQGEQKIVQDGVIYDGNELMNIDPYMVLPDPNTPIENLQNAEFMGFVELSNLFKVLEDEKNRKDYFNVLYLTQMKTLKSTLADFASDLRDRGVHKRNISGQSPAGVSNYPCDIIHFYRRLIPKDWGLGTSQYPERWVFSIAGDAILIRAEPLKFLHNQFPIVCGAAEYDGYSVYPQARMEQMMGVQKILNWLLNTHIANVRHSINNTLIVDPQMVNMADVVASRTWGGGIVKLNRNFQGRGVQNAVDQLQVNDVTRGHVNDAGFMSQLLEQLSGTSAASMGTLRKSGPERLTGKEFAGTERGTINRMERIARILGIQAMQPLGTMLASNIQQFMSEESYVDLMGRHHETLLREFGEDHNQEDLSGIGNVRLPVSPMDLITNCKCIAKDGTVPDQNSAELWLKLYELITNNPILAQRYDTERIFTRIARMGGAKDVDRYVKVGIVPDEQAQEQAQQGNLVETGQAGGIV